MKDFLVRVGEHEEYMLFLVRGAWNAEDAEKQVIAFLTSKYSSSWGWSTYDISSVKEITLNKGVTQL